MVAKTKLQVILNDWEKNGGDLSDSLYELGEYPIVKADDAKTICHVLSSPRVQLANKGKPSGSSFFALVALFQHAKSKEAYEELRKNGLPHLRKRVDEVLSQTTPDEAAAEDVLFALKILATYGQKKDIDLIVKAVRKPLKPDGYLWSVIFEQVGHEHDGWQLLCDGLRKPLPGHFIAVAYLDFANSLAIKGLLKAHPFNNADGVRKLKGWLEDTNAENFSYAQSATAALPFISQNERERLLDLACQHSDISVRMEAAWAMSKLGMPNGEKQLIEWCLDPKYSVKACSYLQELGQVSDIPAKCKDPDFKAMSDMCNWLSHPNEFGYPPDRIELYDKRILYWPPTNDKRAVWLFKYSYNPSATGEEPDIGIAMVGSVTFALFGEVAKELSTEDIYGLHCCWELECNKDPRAPVKMTASAGRAILAKYNKGF